MFRKNTVAIALLMTATAAAVTALFFALARTYPVRSPNRWRVDASDDDPFAEMIEEGDGFLAQLKAQGLTLAGIS